MGKEGPEWGEFGEECRKGTLASLLVTNCCTVWRKCAGKKDPEGAWMQNNCAHAHYHFFRDKVNAEYETS